MDFKPNHFKPNHFWKVFVPGDSKTYPSITKRLCLIFIPGKNTVNLSSSNFCVGYFLNGVFYSLSDNPMYFNKPLFWQYITTLPERYEVLKSSKCFKKGRMCEFEDDGFCLEGCKYIPNCPHRKEVSEYIAIND